MKEQFQNKNFGADALAMIARINGILSTYRAQGFDLSLRQLYYQLVAKALIENTERSYKNIGNLVNEARMAGMVDWDMIKDRGREMVCPNFWTSPAEILKACALQYRVDPWETQPRYVEVMVEKQALEGVLEPVCRDLGVPFTSNKGYCSQSCMYEASKRFITAISNGKTPYILYLGDHDPSGIDMTRDVCDRIDVFVKVSMDRVGEIGDNELDAVSVKRLALNMDQIEVLNPPENPAKLTDSRANGYVKKYGDSSWELDAIEPTALATIVRDAITALIDQPEWKRKEKEVKQGRAFLNDTALEYQKKHK